MNVFIFHGTAGHPKENWFPWLKMELEKVGVETVVPQFPTPVGQSFEAWMEVLKPHLPKITFETILIGHSLGCIFTLRLLETLSQPVKLTVLVGAPIGIRPIQNYKSDYEFSNGFNFDWQKIKQKSKNFIVYHSDNDPYVSLANGQELAKCLGVNLTFVPNAGHFNKAAGYTSFEHIINKLSLN